MKIRLIVLAMAALLLPAPLFGQAYVGAIVGQSDMDTESFEDPTSYSFLAGYRFNDYIAIEGSYVDFGKADDDIPPIWTLEADGFDIGLVGFLPITSNFELFARVGFMNWDAELSEQGFGKIASDDGEDFNYGLGFAYNFTNNFSISAGFHRYRFDSDDSDADVDTIYVGAKYYFGQGRQSKSMSTPSSSYAAQPVAYETASTYSSGPNLRAMTESEKAGCSFVKTISTGAGGPGDPSSHTEAAMNKALTQAANAGADSYYVVDIDTTASGASVVLEALKCN